MKTTLITSILALSLALVPAPPSLPSGAAKPAGRMTQAAASCTRGCFAKGEVPQAASRFAMRPPATPVDQHFAASCTKGCFAQDDASMAGASMAGASMAGAIG